MPDPQLELTGAKIGAILITATVLILIALEVLRWLS